MSFGGLSCVANILFNVYLMLQFVWFPLSGHRCLILSKMRKSERPKQKKRPFSPSDLSGTSYTKETNKEDHLNKQDTKKAPAFDLDPYGIFPFVQ